MQNLNCPRCGTSIDLKDILKDVLNDAVEERTQALTTQLTSLDKLLKQYMEKASDAKARSVELENKFLLLEQESELKVLEQVNNEVCKVKEKISLEAELKVKEKLDTIRQLQEQLALAQKKAEQGSMQQQGEVQEVYIEEYLQKTFPLDSVTEIKKGSNGADVLQVVNTRTSLGIGKIYYESKRTRHFNNAWVEKLKNDMIANGSDVGVLVSSARPAGVDKAVMIKGIWVCSLDEFKLISKLLRDSILKINEVTFFQEHSLEKKDLIYNYITGTEFKLQIEAIVESFSKLQEDLQAEKRAMQMIWKKREKHIQTVLESTIGLYGSIKGLGGNSINTVKSLELYEER